MIIIYIIILLLLGVLFFISSKPKIVSTKKIDRDILIEYSNELDNAMKKIQSPYTSKDEQILEYKRLASLYHNGIPDNYIQGKLIRGVEPNPYRAIELYKTIGQMGDLSVLIEWASIHHYGIPGFEDLENHKKAKEIYLHLYYKTDDDYQKQQAKDKLEELGIKMEVCNVSLRKKKKKKYFPQSLQKSITSSPISNQVHTITLNNTNNTNNQVIQHEIKQQISPVQIRDDKHNVHDSVLVKTVGKAVDTLKNHTQIKYDTSTSLRDIRNFINTTNISQDRKENAIRTLDRIESNNELITAADTKEVDVLHLVWNRIHNDINKDNIQVLKENLINELSESVEHGKIVCTTGRFNRIIDTLNGIDPDISIKPKWALQKEMVEKAGIMFKDFVDKLSPEDKNAFESLNPTPEQEKKNEVLINKIKEDIRKDFKETYVKDGIMTEETLNTEVNQWIDTIV